MFEAEAESFRAAGIRVGADATDAEKSLLEEVLAPFPISLRNDALQMARLYALMHCFENAVRDLIKDRLLDKHGVQWWDKVPKKVRDHAAGRQAASEGESWLEGERTELIDFTEFGHLSDIIVENWDCFSDLITTQHWLKQRFDELEQARHFIAHNRNLAPAEYRRIEMYITDWNRMVGL